MIDRPDTIWWIIFLFFRVRSPIKAALYPNLLSDTRPRREFRFLFLRYPDWFSDTPMTYRKKSITIIDTVLRQFLPRNDVFGELNNFTVDVRKTQWHILTFFKWKSVVNNILRPLINVFQQNGSSYPKNRTVWKHKIRFYRVDMCLRLYIFK